MTRKLAPEELTRLCETDKFDFTTTAEIKPAGGTIGQERAMRSIDFGLSLESKGFNIFALGESGTGKMTSIREKISRLAEADRVPPDWCYVYNFKNPDIPKAISLEPGEAVKFAKDMEELINAARDEMSKVFASKEYEKSKSKIVEDFQNQQKAMLGKLEEEAKSKGFSIRKTVSGLLIVPVKQSGEPLSEEEFEALDDEHKKKIEESGRQLQEKLDDVVRTVRGSEKDIKESLSALEREAALSAVGHLIDELKEKYGKYEKITSYLDEVQQDMLANIEDFRGEEQQQQASPLPFMRPQKAEPEFTRYKVNVLVDNADCKGAPCIFESNPTYFNLFGRVEHKFQYGVATTDFSMIKSGALHRANGGYLILDALDLLKNIFSYDALKRAIREKEVKLEDIWEQYRSISTTMLRPEPIPLNVKVILTGNPYLYYLLYSLDDEYKELFKVKADFDSRMDWNGDTLKKYSDFIASKTQEEGLLPFDRTGVARVIEYSARLAEHKGKLSSKFGDISDVLRESHFWAREANRDKVTREDVEKAIAEKIYRHSRIEDRMKEMMEEDSIIVETTGAKTGQINGLAVLDMGDHSFGKPSRITAKTFAGKAGVVNIERETKMSGKIHEKAILIITNYLGGKYAVKKPITLSASITFEQLYGMIEGDSATCAELYVLLSSLSGVPLRQDLAVTGSMDQNGDVQPIGGVNEKIEGFFDLCRMRGLDGSHGVVIPERNVKNLLLKSEVIDAVRDGKFNIYPIKKMEEGLELFTGMPAGELRDDGTYPEGTVHDEVMKRLDEIREAMKQKKEEEAKDKFSGGVAGSKEEEEEKNG